LRLVAGIAVASWIGALILLAMVPGGSFGPRAALGAGSALLLSAIASTFVAQSRISSMLGRLADTANTRSEELSAGISSAIAPWLLVLGLALIVVAVFTV
jgi:glucan phosphoethanolaminetransferase (alkaline phosphatase superfamily)